MYSTAPRSYPTCTSCACAADCCVFCGACVLVLVPLRVAIFSFLFDSHYYLQPVRLAGLAFSSTRLLLPTVTDDSDGDRQRDWRRAI